MNGFSGPFEYDIDGIIHSWDNLDDNIVEELKASKFSKKNSNIYVCKVCVVQTDEKKQKNHDWNKVKRIFFNITLPNRAMKIIGIHPTNRKKNKPDDEFAFVKSMKSEQELFQMNGIDKLIADRSVKMNSRSDRYSVMSTFNSRLAQWVFSDGWESLDFQLYLYIAVPIKIPDEEKYIYLSIKSVRKKIKTLRSLTVWKEKVEFVRLTDLE